MLKVKDFVICEADLLPLSELSKKDEKGIDKVDKPDRLEKQDRLERVDRFERVDRYFEKPDRSKPIALPAPKSMRRSASTSGLSLVIHPADENLLGSPCAGNTSSTNSSRDSSPCRDPPSPFAITNHSLIQSSKPPIVVRRGPRGFGFTIHTVRVYYGDTDYYTMHHLVSVLRLLLAAPHATLRATPLDQTTIQMVSAGSSECVSPVPASLPPPALADPAIHNAANTHYQRLHPRSAESKCSISPLCCGAGGVGASVGAAVTGARRGGPGAWRGGGQPPPAAPSTPPPSDKTDEPMLPRIAEEKDSPTHHAARITIRTPAKQGTPSIFTSSPKSSLDKGAFDANSSFASLSLSDESFLDTSVDASNVDTSREITVTDNSRSSTDMSLTTSDINKKLNVTQETTNIPEVQIKTRKKSDSSIKEDDKSVKEKSKSKDKQEKVELKKQDSIKRDKSEPKEIKKQDSFKKLEKIDVKQEKIDLAKVDEKEKMERSGSVKRTEESKKERQEREKEAKKLEKQEKAEKKQEKIDAKRSDSMKKENLKKQESVEILKTSESGRGKSVVSKLLGVMGRKRDERDDAAKKQDKHHKRKNSSNSLAQSQGPGKQSDTANVNEKEVEDKKGKKGRGRASSSSSGEK
ncbi:unnamed protein product [Leptidea sinapis]|uniref:Uncharacterized protein n=1 Tax=Leptidea sinapis TaxID=189913 RepID=A0A5E4R4V7_9NEOP|nr:unnamed protein product [Leptidea sinapis]